MKEKIKKMSPSAMRVLLTVLLIGPQSRQELIEITSSSSFYRTIGELKNIIFFDNNIKKFSPTTGTHSPTTGTHSPTTGTHSPTTGTHSPTTGTHSPTTGTHSPTTGTHSPTTGTHSPTTGIFYQTPKVANSADLPEKENTINNIIIDNLYTSSTNTSNTSIYKEEEKVLDTSKYVDTSEAVDWRERFMEKMLKIGISCSGLESEVQSLFRVYGKAAFNIVPRIRYYFDNYAGDPDFQFHRNGELLLTKNLSVFLSDDELIRRMSLAKKRHESDQKKAGKGTSIVGRQDAYRGLKIEK